MFTNWIDDKPETFIIFNCVWSVRMAKKILIDYPRQSIDIDPREWLGFLKIINPATTVSPVDLSVPIICIKWWKGYFPIDGWHRIQKGLELGILLPSVRLDGNESGLVKVS